MSQPKTWDYWAIRLGPAYDDPIFRGGLCGVGFWPEANPRGLNGISLFGTRGQARVAKRVHDAAQHERKWHVGQPVRVRVTILEAGREPRR